MTPPPVQTEPTEADGLSSNGAVPVPHVMQSKTVAWARLLRPADWLKNVLVLAALIFGSRLNNSHQLIRALVAFVAFTFLSSGFYSVNDGLDGASDRTHPLKRARPVPSGAIARSHAIGVGITLILIGIALGFWLTPKLGLICLFYALLQIAYNARLKRVALYDVTALSLGFVLRAAAGGAAIGAHISVWFIMGVYELCLFLALIKRLADLTTARRAGSVDWRSPAGYDDASELSWNSGLAAALTITTYLTYTLSPHAATIFGKRALMLALLTPLLIVAMQRLYRRAREGWSDRPLDAFVQDRGFRYSVLLYMLIVVFTLYPPHLGDYVLQFFQ